MYRCEECGFRFEEPEWDDDNSVMRCPDCDSDEIVMEED
jgi:predicted Zn-ribbon and HTH transcriptional regulator